MIKIRNFEEKDYPSVKEIYQQGIDTGHATFQTKAQEWQEWNNTVLEVGRLVAVEDNKIVGWAALSPVSDRCVYGGVAEVTVYVAKEFYGKGIGHKLLSSLITESQNENMWTLQAGIFPENEASIKLHQKNDFRIVGTREKLGKMNGVWRDVVLLERRSEVIGLE